ncbi:hypothetical protein [Caldithrix abyssi]
MKQWLLRPGHCSASDGIGLLLSYNTKRLHSAIYYLIPEDVLLDDRTKESLKERQQKLDADRAHRLKLIQ